MCQVRNFIELKKHPCTHLPSKLYMNCYWPAKGLIHEENLRFGGEKKKETLFLKESETTNFPAISHLPCEWWTASAPSVHSGSRSTALTLKSGRP